MLHKLADRGLFSQGRRDQVFQNFLLRSRVDLFFVGLACRFTGHFRYYLPPLFFAARRGVFQAVALAAFCFEQVLSFRQFGQGEAGEFFSAPVDVGLSRRRERGATGCQETNADNYKKNTHKEVGVNDERKKSAARRMSGATSFNLIRSVIRRRRHRSLAADTSTFLPV